MGHPHHRHRLVHHIGAPGHRNQNLGKEAWIELTLTVFDVQV